MIEPTGRTSLLYSVGKAIAPFPKPRTAIAPFFPQTIAHLLPQFRDRDYFPQPFQFFQPTITPFQSLEDELMRPLQTLGFVLQPSLRGEAIALFNMGTSENSVRW